MLGGCWSSLDAFASGFAALRLFDPGRIVHRKMLDKSKFPSMIDPSDVQELEALSSMKEWGHPGGSPPAASLVGVKIHSLDFDLVTPKGLTLSKLL